MEPDLTEAIGRALRAARLTKGMTLRQTAAASDGGFAASSIACYERAERRVAVDRFCELCRVYGVAPDGVLRDALRRAMWDPGETESMDQGLGVRAGDVEVRYRAGEPFSAPPTARSPRG
jgi:transcriptional regulator with XRE-family HTH domain